MAGLPKGMPTRGEAYQVVIRTLKILRINLNQALLCKLRDTDFNLLTKMVMDTLYPPKKRKRQRT
jgi:hypothetical protein